MNKHTNKQEEKAQSLIEYTIVIGVVILVLFAMSPLLRRSIQGLIKLTADQIGYQQNGDQEFDEQGHLVSSYAATRADIDKETDDVEYVTSYTHDDTTIAFSNAWINLGFTEQTP